MKILVNSYPRSGTTTLVDAIRVAVMSDKLNFGEEFFHNKNWIAKSHIPVLFLGSFPEDILVATILRDPIDAISSNCFRWSNGYTGNIVQGKIVVDKTREAQEDKFDDVLKSLILHQVKQYISYYSCLEANSSNIFMIKYNDIQENTRLVIDRVISASNEGTESLNYAAAEHVIRNPPQPTKEKTELYYKIRDYISSLSELESCFSLYNKLLKIEEEKNA